MKRLCEKLINWNSVMTNLADKENVFINVEGRYIFQLSHENKFTVPLISILFKWAAWIPPLLRSLKTVLLKRGIPTSISLPIETASSAVTSNMWGSDDGLSSWRDILLTKCTKFSSFMQPVLLSAGQYTKKVQATMVY